VSYFVLEYTLAFQVSCLWSLQGEESKGKHRVEVRKEEMGEKRWNQVCPQGLEAEYMVLQNGNDDYVVQKAFEKAISTPARAGFLQDAAPANERAESFLFCVSLSY
jgi:hypothetical protein